MKEYKDSRFYKYMNMLNDIVDIYKKNKIAFIFFQTPVAERIENLSLFERERLEEWEFDFNNINDDDLKVIKQLYGDSVNIEYLRNVYDGAKVFDRMGIKCLADYSSQYVNIINGKRVTTHQPKKFNNTVYIFGQCTARGTGVEDSDTIASNLQRMLNQNIPNGYRVVNMAIGCGSDLFDDMEYMRKQEYSPGDIVLLCTNLEIVPNYVFDEYDIEHVDLSPSFNRPHEYGEWFTDMTFHTNAVGNKIIAQKIEEHLTQNGYLKNDNMGLLETKKIFNCKEIDLEENEILEYVKNIKKYYKEGVNGAIVMNCNPFTLGHQYLIEYASKEVDNLYIFVVQEDKSFFKYEDRFELVKAGTKKYSNVMVLPSGSYIISATTFPGYFYKDYNRDVIIDTSKDIAIFGKYIAPALSIAKRFVGEEPIDYITRQYNNEMRENLSKYGIEFVEIKRKSSEGTLISASYVRKLLESKQWNIIKKLVPETTLNYLVKRFDDNQ